MSLIASFSEGSTPSNDMWPFKTGGVYGAVEHNTPSTASLTTSIAKQPTTMMEHSTVWIECSNLMGFTPNPPTPPQVYDPQKQEITYIHTVRGSPLPAFTAPADLVSEWNDPNIAYGYRVAFHFTETGTYTIDTFAIDQDGNWGTTSTTVNVTTAADTFFSGTQTICFSNDPNENWVGEKTGCQRITTVPALQSAINSASNPLRVLFKRGQTVPNVDIEVDTGRMSYYGTWGSGAKPTLNSGIINLANDNVEADLRIIDIDFLGPWNASTETGARIGSLIEMAPSRTAANMILYGVRLDGYSLLNIRSRQELDMAYQLVNCYITNWFDYGITAGRWDFSTGNAYGDHLAVIGSQIEQKSDALNGGDNFNRTGQPNKSQPMNRHAPLRLEDPEYVYLGSSVFFSRNGHSSQSPDAADQPAGRINTDGIRGAQYNVDRCVFKGGNAVISCQNQADDPGGQGNNVSNPWNGLFDKVIVIGTTKSTSNIIEPGFGGTTFRNILIWMPNVPRHHPVNIDDIFEFNVQNPASDNRNNQQAIYNVTAISDRNQANDSGDNWDLTGQTGNFNTIVTNNNIVHAPNLDSPVTSGDGLDTSETLSEIGIPYLGVAYDNPPLDPTGSDQGQVCPVPRPTSGHPAYQSATTGRVAYDDLFGTPRPSNASQGAVEPA